MVFDTSTLEYNLDTHKYYVTLDGVKSRFNLDLSNELDGDDSGNTEASVFIKQVSDRVYRWLYAYVRPECVRLTEKRIADNFEPMDYGFPYREALEEALYAQVEYTINFDGDLEAIHKDDLNKLVSVESKAILKAAGVAHKKRSGVKVSSDEWRVGY